MNTADKDALVESVAKAIYKQWVAVPGYVAWIERGNSTKQNDARSIAREAIAAAELVSASPLAGEVRTDIEWQRLPEIRAKFLDYVDEPTDKNALRIIDACRGRFAATIAATQAKEQQP